MKQNAKRALSLLLALMMLCSLCVNALAVNEVKVNATLDKNEITTSSEPQTVKVTIAPETALTVSNYGMTSFLLPEGWTIAAIENDDPNAVLAAGDVNLENGSISWMTDDMENTTVSKLATYTITVPANVEPGSYTLAANKIVAGRDYAEVWVLQDVSPSATLTVTGAPAADGYTVAVSTANAKINKGDTAMVKLAISNPDVAYYNAVDMKLTYDASVLSFDQTKSTGLPADATVTDTNGGLRIQFYGADRTDEIQLAFNGIAAGKSDVKVTEAHVDESANANVQDAPAAAVTGSAVITVGQTYNVTLPDGSTDTAVADEDYTFTLGGGLDGSYMDVKYTVGGVEKTLTANADGSYTIPKEDVTGDITITAVGHEFTVTVTGTGAADVTAAAKAAYGTDYTFTLTPEEKYAYDVKVTVNGADVGYTEVNDTYTIDGKKITGNVTITVTKEADKAQIKFAGGAAADVAGGASQIAEPGKDFTFTINKEEGYDYTVTAIKADGTAVTVTENSDGTYTIAGADIKAGDVITVTVEKVPTGDKYTVVVNEYVKLDGKAVFLVTAAMNEGKTLAEGKVLAYNGDTMFQNTERYDGAYAYLVISDKTLDEVKAEAAGKITDVTGTAQTFNVNGDVNGTGLVDINDAQLVYNIYNAKYDSFDNTTMAMFLAADMNGSKTVDVNDAAAVVAKIQ